MKALLVLAVVAPVAAGAQGLVVGGGPAPAAPPPAIDGCVAVTAGRSTSYGCGGGVAAGQAGQAANAVQGYGKDAPAPRLGVYNHAAVAEQFGNTYGKSTVPQQVPPPHFTSPLVPPR